MSVIEIITIITRMNMAIPPRKEICLPVAQWPQAEKSMYLKAIIYDYY